MICVSPNGTIRDANNLAIKILRLDPKNYIGSNLAEHCRKKQYSLIILFDKQNTPTVATVKETYMLDKEIACTSFMEKNYSL